MTELRFVMDKQTMAHNIENTRKAILREVENESFCFLSLGSRDSNYSRQSRYNRSSPPVRTHPFNHAIRDGWDRSCIVDKMSSWMTKTMNLHGADMVGCAASMYLSESDCEKAVALAISKNVDVLSTWVEDCRNSSHSDRLQRISFDTFGNCSYRQSQGVDFIAASRVSDMFHQFTSDELRDMPDGACCFKVSPVASTVDDRAFRQPVSASVVRCEEQSVTLQFDPDSPCGFVVVTAYPLGRFASRKTPESFYDGNVYSEMMSEAYRQTSEGRSTGVSSSYDTLSVMARMTPGVSVYHNEKRQIKGCMHEGINLVFGKNGQYDGRFFVDEGSITEIVTDNTGRIQGSRVRLDNELLAPFREQLEGMFGKRNDHDFWPSLADPAGMTNDMDVSRLLNSVRETNRNRMTGRYAQGNLAIYSQDEPVTFVMSSRDPDQRYAVVCDSDGVFAKPSVDADDGERIKLSFDMFEYGGSSDFAKEMMKFQSLFNDLMITRSDDVLSVDNTLSFDDMADKFYDKNIDRHDQIQAQYDAIMDLPDKTLSEKLSMLPKAKDDMLFGDYG